MRDKEIKIAPPSKVGFSFSELWENRELLYFFSWRDIKIKYKQTYLGVAWIILQPSLLTLIFYFVFFKTLKINTGIIYPIYTFGGLVLWTLFSSGITLSSESLLNSSNIIRKIYFPRLLIPIASIIVSLIDFVVAFALFILLIFCFQQPIYWQAFFLLPLAALMTTIASFGIGILLAALNVKYRDFRYILPFGIQLLFFSSQVVYSIKLLPQTWIKWLLYCNPLNGALELFYACMHKENINLYGVAISVVVSAIFLTTGLLYFKKTEVYFADII